MERNTDTIPATLASTRFRMRDYLPRMFRRACLSALFGMTACSLAMADSPPPLSEEQVRAAEFIEGLSIPNPGELFAAFGKSGKPPDWSTFFRKQAPAAHFTRPVIALNLGIRIADGFLAAEAQDRQQVKNVSTEIKLLAKSLGLEQEFMVRNNSISDFADSRRWDALAEEIEAMRSELAATMEGQRDSGLVMLMSLGCWLRSVDVASGQLAADYTPEGAGILCDPAVGEFFAARLEALPAKVRAIPAVAEIQRRLPTLSLAKGTPPSKEAATSLHRLASNMVSLIAAPEK